MSKALDSVATLDGISDDGGACDVVRHFFRVSQILGGLTQMTMTEMILASVRMACGALGWFGRKE